MPITIIAEAGVNHNGRFDLACQLIDAAADAGADVVKFQTFVPEEEISRFAPKAEYQLRTTDAGASQLDMARKLRLPDDAFFSLAARCRERGVRFLSTPSDLPSIDFLAHAMGLDILKLPSGEITDGPFLLSAACTGCHLILSTGMATLDEVRQALAVLAYGFVHGNASPSLAAFRQALDGEAGRTALETKVTLLHCTTEYPAPIADANIRAMDTLRKTFALPTGLSDHTPGIAVAVAAAARGAVIIEKHFTLDRSLPGPDHKASLEPDELGNLVSAIRQVEAALGDGTKAPMPSEIKNMPIARKSLVAARRISKDEPFTEENLTAKRPGFGISPMQYWNWLERKALRAYAKDELIEP